MSTQSQFFTPTNIIQNAPESSALILFRGTSFPIQTASDLYHITGTGGPGPYMTDVQTQTTQLVFTGFNITNVPSSLSGVQMNLDIVRNGRVCDGDIYLTYNGSIIGQNQSNYDEDVENHLLNFNKNVYGGDNNFWGATLTPDILQDSSFGIVIRLRSHPQYPHRTGAMINNVRLSYYS
jgi:hypothetical protein